MLGMPESERLKVTALPSPERLRAGRPKSFPPDSPPLSKELVFSYCDTVSKGREIAVFLPLQGGGQEGDGVSVGVVGVTIIKSF